MRISSPKKFTPEEQKQDWALCVGIAHYPRFGATPLLPNHLKGPVNDAEDIADVLKTDYGVKYLTLLTSPKKAKTNTPPRPISAEIEDWFQNLLIVSAKFAGAGLSPKVGRRLYVYLSGHGIAFAPQDCALVTSESIANGMVSHVVATSYVSPLCDRKLFDEYVFWMDCCSQVRVTLTPRLAPFDAINPAEPQPPKMVVVAASYPGLAIELPIGNGGAHRGVFSYVLAAGLRGAAANREVGGITTEDLRNYLLSAMPKLIEPHYRLNRKISKEPNFIFHNRIEFKSKQQAPPLSKLRVIQVPVADGTRVSVQNNDRKVVHKLTAQGGQIACDLTPGFYKLFWAGGSLMIDVEGEDSVNGTIV